MYICISKNILFLYLNIEVLAPKLAPDELYI